MLSALLTENPTFWPPPNRPPDFPGPPGPPPLAGRDTPPPNACITTTVCLFLSVCRLFIVRKVESSIFLFGFFFFYLVDAQKTTPPVVKQSVLRIILRGRISKKGLEEVGSVCMRIYKGEKRPYKALYTPRQGMLTSHNRYS